MREKSVFSPISHAIRDPGGPLGRSGHQSHEPTVQGPASRVPGRAPAARKMVNYKKLDCNIR